MDILGEALHYQYMFTHQTPMEMDYDELEEDNIEIDLEKVDRVYHIKFSDYCGVGERDFEFIGWMQYGKEEEKPLYVEMIASCDLMGFQSYGGGHIYVSRDADLFMDMVLNEEKHDIYSIYQSLAEDGIRAEKKWESYNWNPTEYYQEVKKH